MADVESNIVTCVTGGRAEADRWVKSLGNIIDRNNLEISLLVELATSGSIKVCSGGIPASRHSPRRRRTACLRGPRNCPCWLFA